MRTKSILILAIPVVLLAWCVSAARWSTASTEEVLLSNGEKVKVSRTTHFRQAGSDTTLGFGRGGVAREWSVSFHSAANLNQDVTWEAEDRIPILLDVEEKTGRIFLVGVKPFSNGLLGDHHWPSGNQNPYYVYELDGQTWKEVSFRSNLIGRKNNLLVRFEDFYVKSPTPRDIGHVTLEKKARLESEQDAGIKADRYKYNLKYRVIGDHMPKPNTTPNAPSKNL